MATEIALEPALPTTVPCRPRLHYRGFEVPPASLRVADPPRAGRRMFWRGLDFDGALLDTPEVAARAGERFYRGVFF